MRLNDPSCFKEADNVICLCESSQQQNAAMKHRPKQGRLVVIAEHDNLNTLAVEKILAG